MVEDLSTFFTRTGTPVLFFVLRRIQQNAEQLRSLGFNASTYVSPGTAHEWQTWRRSLYHFLQLIFK